MSKAPTFDELQKLSRKESGEKRLVLSFDHGHVKFAGRKDKKRADIEADLWGTRDIDPKVTAELEERYREYIAEHPEVRRGGAMSKFGRTVIHCHVMVEDADEWLSLFFDVVSDDANLMPEKSPEDVISEIFGPSDK